MATASLVSIELRSFKSFKGEVLPLDDVTVLTGRNSSGKSNALDAAEVLSRLATGEDVYDALDGRRREGGPIRGGLRGCAPTALTLSNWGVPSVWETGSLHSGFEFK
jgi:hypothetical protein